MTKKAPSKQKKGIPYAKEKSKTIDDLRHNVYYGTQEIFDSLYAKK